MAVFILEDALSVWAGEGGISLRNFIIMRNGIYAE